MARLLHELYSQEIASEQTEREELLARSGATIQQLLTARSAPDRSPAKALPPLTADESSASLQHGTILGERYQIDRMLQEGGMGTVYEATHIGIEKRVAVKVLHPVYSRMPDVVSRFRREARAASRIGNPHIIEIYDSGTTADGCFYFAMEHLEGQDLAELLKREGPLSVERATRIATQICKALGPAHDAGIVHRDLKPDNIFIVAKPGEVDFVKVLDFGIAQSNQVDDTQKERLTNPGMAMGTPQYMAPEQAAGEECDHRADIYAVGAIVYEMLVGYPPHRGNNMLDVLNRKALPVESLQKKRPDVPSDVHRIVHWSLEYNPSDRPQSMSHLAYELDKLNKGRAGAVASILGLPKASAAASASNVQLPLIEHSSSQHPPVVLRGKSNPNRKLLFGALGASALLIIAGFAMFFFGDDSTQSEPSIAKTPKALAMPSRGIPYAAVSPESTNNSVSASQHTSTDTGGHRRANPSLDATIDPQGRSNPSLDAGISEHETSDAAGHPNVEPFGITIEINTDAGVDKRRASVNPRTLLTNGRRYLRLGRFKHARRAFQAAQRYGRTRGGALVGLAKVEFQLGRYTRAKTLGRRAARAGGGIDAQLVLGNANFKLGRFADAVQHYRRVLKKRPTHREARRNLAAAQKRLTR